MAPGRFCWAALLMIAAAVAGTHAAAEPLACGTAGGSCAMLGPRGPLLRWRALPGDSIEFNATYDVPAGTRFLGLGLSETGSMKGADVWALTQASAGGAWALEDQHAAGFEAPVPDASQDAVMLGQPSVTPLPGGDLRITVRLSRKLNPCDAQDLPIQPGVATYVIWAFASRPKYHGPTNRGSAQLVLLPAAAAAAANGAGGSRGGGGGGKNEANAVAAGAADPQTKVFGMQLARVPVPAEETTYVYKLFKLPADRKYHVTRIVFEHNSSYVHHAVAYTCAPGAPAARLAQLAAMPYFIGGNGSAIGTEARGLCSTFWGLGAPGMPAHALPAEAGLPMGKGTDVTWALLEVHLNNPRLVSGDSDTGAGLSIHYTPRLRPNDMGLLTVSQWGLFIPPGLPSFSAPPSACPGDCTSRLPGPVTLSSQVIHMHGLGKSALTRRFYQGKERPPLLNLRAYDYGFQQWVPIAPDAATLMPGERLEVTCTYDSTERANMTRFGPATSDEMCFHWIYYYPAAPGINLCTSLGKTGYAACSADEAPLYALYKRNVSQAMELMLSGALLRDAGASVTAGYAPYKPPACAPAPTATRALL